jgi:hypothetical protein
MNDTDARLWHPRLRINRVLRVMLQTRERGGVVGRPRRVQAGVRAATTQPRSSMTPLATGPVSVPSLVSRGRTFTEIRSGANRSIRARCWYRIAGQIAREQKDLAVEIIEAEIRSAQHEVLLDAPRPVLSGEPIEIARQPLERAEWRSA